MIRPVLAALAALSAACATPSEPGRTVKPVAADAPAPPDMITENDWARLRALPAHRVDAIDAMNRLGDPTEAATANAVLEAPAQPVDAASLPGVWDCRVMKLGGGDLGLPIVIYDWFECRIARAEDGLRFRKITGSQRTEGYLHPYGEAMLYLGALRYDDDPPPVYGTGPERDQVAVLHQLGPDRLRMEFPAPYYESRFDVLELRR